MKTRREAKANKESGKESPEKENPHKSERGISHKTLYKKETPNIPT